MNNIAFVEDTKFDQYNYRHQQHEDKISYCCAQLYGKIDLLEMPEMANKIYQINELEIPCSAFADIDESNLHLQQFKTECKKNNIRILTLIIDNCGSIADLNAGVRNQNIQCHFKWIKIVHFLGYNHIKIKISDIPINDKTEKAIADGLLKLEDFAELFNVEIVVDCLNGELNSQWINNIIKALKRPNCYIVGNQFNSSNANSDIIYNRMVLTI